MFARKFLKKLPIFSPSPIHSFGYSIYDKKKPNIIHLQPEKNTEKNKMKKHHPDTETDTDNDDDEKHFTFTAKIHSFIQTSYDCRKQ